MPSPQQTLLCQYRYDPLDRLIGHAQSATPELQRFYCKSRLATEVQGAVGHSIVQHGDLLLAQHQRHNGGLVTTLLATDLQRSVLHTLKANQKQPIAYSPYGHRPTESGLTSLLGFNGEQPDPVTGHYLLGNGYRAFNPVLMRFNSPDSLSPFGKGGLNSYAYCLGDPVNQGDPDGKSPSAFFRALFTRTIKIDGTTFKMRPEITIVQAMRARREMKIILKELDTTEELLQKTFKADKSNSYAPPLKSQQISLQDIAADAINSDSRIDSSQLPNPLNRFIKSKAKFKISETNTIKHFYEETSSHFSDKLSISNLDWIASQGSHVNPNRDRGRFMQLAENYQQRISPMRQTRSTLENKLASIRDENFR